MNRLLYGLVVCLVAMTVGCATTPKAKPRVPLALTAESAQPAIAATEQGSKAYESKQFEDAKALFQQAVIAAPTSGEAHYNLGLALSALGDTDLAHEEFIEASNLAPGNKVIWDSPALRPFGTPDPSVARKGMDYQGRAGQKTMGPGGGGLGFGAR